MTEVKRRGRPPKARLEGEAVEETVETVADPVPGNNGAALSRIVEYFKTMQPEAWDELRLCPLQHGIEDMIVRLK